MHARHPTSLCGEGGRRSSRCVGKKVDHQSNKFSMYEGVRSSRKDIGPVLRTLDGTHGQSTPPSASQYTL